MLVKLHVGFVIVLMMVVNAVMDDKSDVLQKAKFLSANRKMCCPIIDTGPHGSVIEPFSGYRGYAVLIVNCTTSDQQSTSFYCCVDWGDGSPTDCTGYASLGNCEMFHQYSKHNYTYKVVAYYCSFLSSTDFCCDNYSSIINVVAV